MESQASKSLIVQKLISKIKARFPKDISIFACYGSYVTGKYTPRSDIDFYVIPKTDNGYSMSETFIIDDIGYDLWPLSWQRLEDISNLESPLTSILLDSEVLFYGDDMDMARYSDCQEHTKGLLADRDLRFVEFEKQLVKVESSMCRMEDENAIELKQLKAISIAEDCLGCLATANGRYVRRGIYNIKEEVSCYELIPELFVEKITQVLTGEDFDEAIEHLKTIITSLGHLSLERWELQSFESNALPGFYEEMKSVYNKLLNACDTRDRLKAIYAAKLIDHETLTAIGDDSPVGSFTKVLHSARSCDYDDLRKVCKEHERQLVKLYELTNTSINKYDSLDDF